MDYWIPSSGLPTQTSGETVRQAATAHGRMRMHSSCTKVTHPVNPRVDHLRNEIIAEDNFRVMLEPRAWSSVEYCTLNGSM